MIVAVTPGGGLQFIHNDLLADLYAEGTATIKRASDVEPNEKGQWVADMGRVNGPLLPPCALREDALALEVEWLTTNYIGRDNACPDNLPAH